jgi:hypothetical protein
VRLHLGRQPPVADRGLLFDRGGEAVGAGIDSGFTHDDNTQADAKLLQGLVRQARKDRLVYLVLAEGRLVLPEAQAPQPVCHVQDTAAPASGSDMHLRVAPCLQAGYAAHIGVRKRVSSLATHSQPHKEFRNGS